MSSLISSVLKLSKLAEICMTSEDSELSSSRVANGISTVLPDKSDEMMLLSCLEHVVLKVALTTKRLFCSAV